MQVNSKENSEFLNPYRQNPRCFSKYFKNCSKLSLSSSRNSNNKQQGFLDNVSKASSMKFREESVQNITHNKSHIESQLNDSYFLIKNKRKSDELHNPQIFHLVSKHIETNQFKNQKSKKLTLKAVQSLMSQRIKSRSHSVYELEITPKITQFSRQTFYRSNSQTKREYSSKKQKQDILHSKSNMDINTKKQTICKKTRPYKDSRSFVTYELYFLKSRVGVDVQILAGSLKQIKFRLILNQSDTQTFNKYWSIRMDEFIDKCLIVNDDGISLKIGAFNFENQTKQKSSRIKQVQKVYLQHYESLLKRQNSKKITRKIGNIQFSQQYQPNQIDLTERQTKIQEKSIEHKNQEIESDKKDNLNDNKVQNKQQHWISNQNFQEKETKTEDLIKQLTLKHQNYQIQQTANIETKLIEKVQDKTILQNPKNEFGSENEKDIIN